MPANEWSDYVGAVLSSYVGASEWDGYIWWGVMRHDAQVTYYSGLYPWGQEYTLAPEAYGRFYYTRLQYRDPGLIICTQAYWKGARMVDLWYYNP
jgi:hypothetical protein